MGKSQAELEKYLVYQKKNRGKVTHIANRLGNPEPIEGDWLVLTPKDKMPLPEIVAFPKPPKAADGSLMYERIPSKGEIENKNQLIVSSPANLNLNVNLNLKRRHFEEVNGVVEPSMNCFLI